MTVSTQWRYEAATKTIRATPSNHWIASMDSWDGAVDHGANARVITAAPSLLSALEALTSAFMSHTQWNGEPLAEIIAARAAIAQAKGA